MTDAETCPLPRPWFAPGVRARHPRKGSGRKEPWKAEGLTKHQWYYRKAQEKK